MKKLMFVAVFGLAGLLAACGDSGGSGGSSGIVGTWKVDTEYLKTMMDAKMKEQAGGDEVPQAMLDMMKPMLDKMMTEMGKITITFNADGTMTGVGPKESDGPPVMETKKGKWTKTDKGYKVEAEGDEKALHLVMKDGYLEATPDGQDEAFRLVRA
ncbi:MAG: DUF4923 family protein [Planctomycetes bacterium]|nr:DUF4923 family protein [Planctomycetota bacterium]MCB9829905.1 DUF4923 family protein [Planctomycetota bacterium]MCB9900905.1 DUF4923 family protein [Planctomycetota bacterium]